MISFALVTAVVALAGALVLIGWLVHGRVDSESQEADWRVAQVATEAELERVQFELEATQKALRASMAREQILDRAIAETLNANAASTAHLRPDDVLGRVRLYTAEWARTDARDPVPPDRPEAVPSDPATGSADAPAVPAVGPVP